MNSVVFIAALVPLLLTPLVGYFILLSILPKKTKKAISELKLNDLNLNIQDIVDVKNVTSLNPIVEEHIDEFLNVKLPQKMPMIAMFAGDKFVGEIKQQLLEEIDILLPKLIEKFTSKNISGAQLQGMVQGVLLQHPLMMIKVEKAIYKHAVKLLVLVGFIVGVLTSMLVALLIKLP